MACQLARLFRLVISRREKKRLRVPNLRQKKVRHSTSIMNLQKPLSLTRCLPWAQRTFHVFLSPLPFALSPIFLVVIPPLVIMHHPLTTLPPRYFLFTYVFWDVFCIMPSQENAFCKPQRLPRSNKFVNCVVDSSLHPFGESHWCCWVRGP